MKVTFNDPSDTQIPFSEERSFNQRIKGYSQILSTDGNYNQNWTHMNNQDDSTLKQTDLK